MAGSDDRASHAPGHTFDLGMADQMAGYRWGSLFCHFLMAPTKVRSLAEILASFGARRWTWHGDEPMARATIAFLHELTHLLQDVATGVGNWDYLVRQQYIPKLLAKIWQLSWEPRLKPPYDVGAFDGTPFQAVREEVEDLRQQMLGELICLPSPLLPEPRRTAIAEAIMAGISNPSAISSSELGEAIAMLEPESLLENEAMASVFYILYAMDYSDEDWRLLRSIDILWDGNRMPVNYRLLFQNFFTVLGDPPEDPGSLHRFALLGALLFNFVSDIAMAYPSPGWLERSGQSRSAYEPGIRFRCLMRALREMDSAHVGPFLEAAQSDAPGEAEALLLMTCDYPYPASRDIYADWAETLSKVPDDPVADVRAAIASRRAADGAWTLKSADQALQYEVPIHIYSSMGYQRIRYHGEGILAGVSGIYSDTISADSDLDDLEAEIVVRALDDAVITYLLDTGTFRCPLATRGLCDARVPQCRTGYRSFTELPPSPGCHARTRLYDMSFNTMWTASGRIPDEMRTGPSHSSADEEQS